MLSHTRGTNSVWGHIEASLDPNYFAAFLSPVLADSTHHEAAEARLSSLMSSTAQAVGLLPLDLSSATPEEIASANQAERLFNERAYGEALKSYRKMLTLRPSDASMLYDYATCLLHLGRYDDGIQAYSKAIELNPTLPWTYFNRGVAHHLKGDPASAIIDYVRGLQSKPAYAQGYNNLALAQRDLGDLQNADLHAGKAIELDPYYAPSFFNWATILLKMGNQEEALSLKDKGEALTIPRIGTQEKVLVKSENESVHHP
jgi:tetratricopeptide (TPR) repeat protein